MSASSHRDGTRVPVLDLLRLVAVLGVVLFHYGFRGPATGGIDHTALPNLSWFARYGFLGVPIFFIISGFVIAYSAQGRSATEFAIARFARIYPGFLFCMTLTFVSVLAFGAPHFATGFAQWTANLFVAATAFNQHYMDSAYWSLVVELVFYAWLAAFIAAGLFPRRVDMIVLVWLGISLLNELTVDIGAVGKLLLADYSGFFATGILIYELHRGRRDALLQWLMVLSVGTALFQEIHNLRWLRDPPSIVFDDWIVAAICLASILAIIGATRIRTLPISSRAVIAIGGVTYPFYLLHQQLGYVLFSQIGPVAHPAVLVALIVAAIAVVSWATWRFVERPCQRWTRQVLTDWAGRSGRITKPGVNPTAI